MTFSRAQNIIILRTKMASTYPLNEHILEKSVNAHWYECKNNSALFWTRHVLEWKWQNWSLSFSMHSSHIMQYIQFMLHQGATDIIIGIGIGQYIGLLDMENAYRYRPIRKPISVVLPISWNTFELWLNNHIWTKKVMNFFKISKRNVTKSNNIN